MTKYKVASDEEVSALVTKLLLATRDEDLIVIVNALMQMLAIAVSRFPPRDREIVLKRLVQDNLPKMLEGANNAAAILDIDETQKPN